jgi:hypothetical protein
MAQETAAERIARMAKEAEAQKKAAEAQEAADKRAAEDGKVAESKARQEREELEADNRARAEQAQALATQNAQRAQSVGVTPNAAGAPIPETVQPVQSAPVTAVAVSVAPDRSEWRTFQHQYANANTIMPDGKKLIFGGQNGNIGQYSTNVPEQIKWLADLARTPGSMVTEVRKDADGRFIVVTDAILDAERQAVLIDSRTNSAADLNPNVVTARANLSRQIAADS